MKFLNFFLTYQQLAYCLLILSSCCTRLESKTYQFMYPSWIPVTIQHDVPFSWNLSLRNDSIYSSYNFLQNSINDMMAFWPQPPSLSVSGIDLNQRSSASIANTLPSIQLNLKPYKLGSLTIAGTYAGGFIPLGFLLSTNQEAVSNIAFISDQVYITLQDPRTSIILGLASHPFCRPVHPHTVSITEGVPIAPGASNPQVSIEHPVGNVFLQWTAYTQFLNQSNGPQGFSTRYIRRAMMPALNMIMQYKDNTKILGIGLDVKRLVPLIATFLPGYDETYIESKAIISAISTIFAGLSTETSVYQAQILVGQNGTDITNLGGYTISRQAPLTNEYTYANVWYVSSWVDMHALDTPGFCCTPGLFAGYSQSLGTRNPINAVIIPFATTTSVQFYGVSPIQQIWRLSPRMTLYYNDNFKVRAEIEYTNTTFGTLDTNGRFGDLQKSQLLRFMISTQVSL